MTWLAFQSNLYLKSSRIEIAYGCSSLSCQYLLKAGRSNKSKCSCRHTDSKKTITCNCKYMIVSKHLSKQNYKSKNSYKLALFLSKSIIFCMCFTQYTSRALTIQYNAIRSVLVCLCHSNNINIQSWTTNT